jgi:hypothetical protein
VHGTNSSAPTRNKNKEKQKALGSFGLKGFPFERIMLGEYKLST